MKEGDIVIDPALGRGMIVYFDVETFPICAFPANPDLILCDQETLERIVNVEDL